MKADVEAVLQGCEVCLTYNNPGPKDPAVTPEIPTEDLQPMEDRAGHNGLGWTLVFGMCGSSSLIYLTG